MKGNGAVVLPGEDECDLPCGVIEDLAEILVRVVLADAIECMRDFRARDFGDSRAEVVDELRVTRAVIEDNVAF